MNRDVAQVSLADALEGWRPAPVEMARRADPWFAEAFADLLDAPRPALLPPLWHWFVLLDHFAGSNTGADGHPADAPFLPPIPGRRRMFAGGRLRQDAPIPLGAELSSRATVSDVTVKTGRSGEMAFVTVRTELFADGAPVGVEEQDIVYRSEPAGTPPRALPPPETDRPEPEGAWRLELTTDPVLLFRFSALTYNGHRIHYDEPYATGAEGYPGLVVHGPLLALLALELPRRHAPERAVRSVEYRLVRPAFAPARIVGAGSVQGSEAEVVVAAQGAAPSLTARVGLA
ncbi:HTD2 family dehydratase [Pseudonocardia adelaidensis]|uniref:FAS1-like dehydratase domain-containing protein n=1 Tax=Pseudonocardia adelaidensis TaxID=648754 RepID=A0ABP9NRG0_9PSEU